MLKVEDLHVSYGRFKALHGINFEVGDNQIVAMIGANGAGKSTSLMTISGLVAKESGKIIYKDKDITNVKPHIISNIPGMASDCAGDNA